jgi:outer membrane protein TolC
MNRRAATAACLAFVTIAVADAPFGGARADEPSSVEAVAASTPTAAPSAARTVTLEEAFVLARRHASDLRIADVAIDRANASERIALAALLPQVNGSLSYTQFDQAIERGGLVIRQPFSIGGNLSVSENLSLRSYQSYRSAGVSRQSSEAQLADARRTVLAAVARAYFSELAAERNAALARSQLEAATRQHVAVRARVDAGIAVALDASRSELAMLEAATRVADNDAALARAQDLFGQALGLEESVGAAEAPFPNADEPVGHYVSRALSSRSDLRVGDLRRESARLSRQDAWFRFAPTLNLAWNLNWTPQVTAFQPRPVQWSAVATLNIPFYDGGARYGALRDADGAIAQAQEQYEALERSIRIDVRDAHRRVETTGRAIEFARRSEQVATLAVGRAEASYAAGASTGLELDDARRSLEQAQLTVLVRVLERQLAVVDLLTHAGEDLLSAGNERETRDSGR